MEIGPYRLKDDKTLEINNGSWNEFANLLFVDNPVGTGFSYVDTNAYVHELDDMANQFVQFLEKFYALFPEYEHDDVSFLRLERTLSGDLEPNSLVDLHRRRVVCWTTHSLHIKSHPCSEQAPGYQAYLEPEGPTDRQRLDIAARAIRRLPPICLRKEHNTEEHRHLGPAPAAVAHVPKGPCCGPAC
jgi:hypothetical protein